MALICFEQHWYYRAPSNAASFLARHVLVTTSDFGIEEQHHPTTERVAAAEDVVSGIRRGSEEAGDGAFLET